MLQIARRDTEALISTLTPCGFPQLRSDNIGPAAPESGRAALAILGLPLRP